MDLRFNSMYIIELFINWLNKNRRGKGANPDKTYKESELSGGTNEVDEAINCEHNFMPVDSTGNVLACTKCGFVIHNRK